MYSVEVKYGDEIKVMDGCFCACSKMIALAIGLLTTRAHVCTRRRRGKSGSRVGDEPPVISRRVVPW